MSEGTSTRRRPTTRRGTSGRRGPRQPKPRAFWPTAARLVRELLRHPWRLGLMTVLLVASIVLNVLAPRVLGRATDIIYAGVLSRGLPAGQTSAQALQNLRDGGQQRTADMLSTVDFVPGQGVDFAALGHTLLLVLGMYVLSGLFLWLQARILNDVVMDTVFDLRQRVEEHVNVLPLGWFDSRQRGDVLSRTTNDVDNVQTALQQGVTTMIQSVLMLTGIGVMMFTISWQLALVALVALPLSALAVALVGGRSQKQFARQWAATGGLNGQVEESFTGHELVRAYGRQEQMGRAFAEHNDRLRDAGRRAQFWSGLMMPLMQFVSCLSYVGIAVLGGLKVASGTLSLGAVTAFIQYSREFSQPLGQLAGVANQLQSGIASAERVYEMLDAPSETPDAPGALGSAEHPAPARARGRVEFRDVSFSYTPDRPLIEHLDLVAEPGQTIAIVGPTGAGKTTLVNLLMRFYEVSSGAILLDGTDVREMTRRHLRTNAGMVLQDAMLFTGTIRENIRYGRLDATDEEVLEAAQAAFVDRFVRALPEGYDTVVDDESGAVSAGERQLITIARAFLASPALLILDEATSSVDTRTELLVQQAMSALRASRTSFVIAHRLSTIRDADTIVVMERGRIVEQGSHGQLMAADGTYRALHDAQFAEAAEPGTDASVGDSQDRPRPVP